MSLTAELYATIRPGVFNDATEINALYIDRKFDSEPGYSNFTEKRIEWFYENGESRFCNLIEESQQNPERFFLRVATYQNQIVGFTRAEALSGDPYVWWRGITVSRAFEGQGVGRRLEAARREWAWASNRPIRSLVVADNRRSLSFLQKQGFVKVDVLDPTPESPIYFSVMELGPSALGQVT